MRNGFASIWCAAAMTLAAGCGAESEMESTAAVTQALLEPDVRLTNDRAFSSASFNNSKSMAVSGKAVHVVWFDIRDGNRELYYKRSPDSGTSWGSDIRLTNQSAVSHFSAIAASGSTVHIAWEEHRDGNPEIYYKRSADGGLSWGPDIRMTNNGAQSFSPSLAAVGTTVHLIWYDGRDGNHEVYYKRSSDDGASWGADTRLTRNTAASWFPSVSASGSDVHVVWEEYRDGRSPEVYYKRSADAGVSWGADVRLTSNPARSAAPAVSAAGANVNVVWHDGRDGNLEIYNKHSADGGLSWSADTRLTARAAESSYASVSALNADVHVSWVDERDGNTAVYYKGSADGGRSWGADTRLTFHRFRTTDPSIVASGPDVHVLWTDTRDGNIGGMYNGNYEIYYKRNPNR